jgi:phospholipid/cholesterol/gamma-HCH transport system substrate-binding protein
METKANYAIVGFFTLAVIAAAFGFVYWMAEFGRGGPVAELVIRIPGSANGLSVGSPVRFNGIPVGTVRSLSIDGQDPDFSIAFTEVRADAPVYTSTKAVLEIQGLTGAAYVELSGGKSGEENILKKAIDSGQAAVLTADLSSVTNLLTTADKILQRADDAIGDIQGFVSDARGPLTETVRNAEKFSAAISANSDGIDEFLKSVTSMSGTIKGLSSRVDSTLSAVESLVRAVDSRKIDNILSNAEKVSNDVSDASGKLTGIMESVKQTSDRFNQVGVDAQVALKRIDTLMASIDPSKVSNTVNDVSAASADARSAIASIKDVADRVRARQNEIDSTIDDVSDMANKLNSASTRVDGILVKVDKLLGSDDANSLFAQARQTLASFKSVADNVNARVGPIADNLSRFSSTGLRDIQALIGDTRRTVDSLNSTITNFDRNPQRLLFGGDTVKQYDGRTRR